MMTDAIISSMKCYYVFTLRALRYVTDDVICSVKKRN